jgi:Tol biopolymer transport system component
MVAGGAALLSVGGCSRFYTGSMGVQDLKAVNEYNQFRKEHQAVIEVQERQQQAERNAQALRDRRIGTPVAFEGSSTGTQAPVRAGQGNSAMDTVGDIEAAAKPGNANANVRNMVLYGQLPQGAVGTTSAGSMNPTGGGGGGRASGLDSTEGIQRVTFTTEGADFDPDVDSAGQWIVYASTRHRETADLYLKRVNGSAVTQLTADPGNDVMPVFSPDGRRIAFCSDRAGNWDIYITDITGGQPVQVTSEFTQDIHPSFSPDGRHLVYCSFGSQSGQWELVVVDLDNPSTRKFIGYGLLPRWSPVDNRIAFQRARERGTRWFSVWTIDLVDGEATLPTEVFAATNAAVITPDWSPDGKHLVFCTVIEPGADDSARPAQADVWVGSVDGRNRANLTKSRFANLQPVWGPDGSIFYVTDRGEGGVDNVWAIRPGMALRVVAQPNSPKKDPDNTPTASVPTSP